MKKLSVSLKTEHITTLNAREENGKAASRSEALRQILDEYETLRTECTELRTECEELHTRLENRETRINELEEQLAKRSQIEDKVDTLAKRVEDTDASAPPWPVRWYRWFRDTNTR